MLPLPMRAHLHLLPWVALAAHLGFGLARVPHAVIGKRLDEVQAWGAEGPAHYLFRTAALEGVEAIDELLRTTADDAVIVWRGTTKGAMEVAPALLWPRLLVGEQALHPDATRFLERPVASWHGEPRQLVLVAEGPEGRSLRLAPR